MTFSVFRKDRQVVPRWRSLNRTISSGDLARPTWKPSSGEISLELRTRLEAWRERRDVITAAELVETALVEGHDDEAINAARFLSAKNSNATPSASLQGTLLLHRTGQIGDLPIASNKIDMSPTARARQRTRAFPRDAHAWADLALAYVNDGKNVPSQRAMAASLTLAPNDRHVLRSAARLFLHLGDPEKAHDLLKNNPATQTDPWLMAGEIAVSAVANRKPVFFRKGRELIEGGGINPRHISELAAAVGTVHLKDGNRKARKVFGTSLIDPTGNTLAQAEWASPHVGNLVTPQALNRAQDAAEAEVFQAYWDERLADVISKCEIWHLDEPFSSRPQQFGSGAAITLEQFDTALKFAEDGLKANPKVITLLNNQAFALISLGRLDEAARVLNYCLLHHPDEAQGSITATAGLYAMRLKQFEEGKKRYRQAISYFKKTGRPLMEALALAYFAQEAARAELPEAPRLVTEAKEICKNVKFLPEAKIVLRRADAWIGAIAQRNAAEELLL